MDQHNKTKNACRSLDKESTFYDGMITCSTLPGQAVCGLVWNMGKEKNDGDKVLLGKKNIPQLLAELS